MKSLSLLWLVLIIAIGAAYLFIDRPLCEIIHEHDLPQNISSFLKWMTHWSPFSFGDSAPHQSLLMQFIDWPPLMSGLSPFLLLLSLAVPQGKTKDLLILMSISILLTFVLKNDLKWIFSRDWPMTWTNNNPSWISNHAYGFQWFQGKFFQGNDATGSFPSGHTAIAFATLLPVGLIYPRTLRICMALAILEGLFMVLFDYHFLSDVLAGALLGVSCTLAVLKITEPKNGRSLYSGTGIQDSKIRSATETSL